MRRADVYYRKVNGKILRIEVPHRRVWPTVLTLISAVLFAIVGIWFAVRIAA